MGFALTLYNGVMKRTSTFALAIIVGAFAFERGFDVATTAYWENHNQGKLWKDIKHKYEKEE